MAIYRFEVRSISRKDGRSATAAAAYRSGSLIEDERTGEAHDYTRRQGVAHSEILLPEKAPEAFRDRVKLWNAVEVAERRKDAKVAREIIAALPHELDDTQRRECARMQAQHLVERFGVGVEMSIHAPDREGDQRNWHCHFLFTTREIGPDGLGAKTRQLDVRQTAREEVNHLRERWADFQNRSLEKAGFDERVDHRSLADQGIDRIPEPKLGPVATDMERAGRRSHAGDDLRHVRAENAALEAAIAQRKVIDLEIEREKRRDGQTPERRMAAAVMLAHEFGQQEAELSRQAQALQYRLDHQNALQRFWFNLTGQNVRDTAELHSAQMALEDIKRQKDEARAMLEAEIKARQIAQETQRVAQQQEQVRDERPVSPANDHSAEYKQRFQQAVGFGQERVADARRVFGNLREQGAARIQSLRQSLAEAQKRRMEERAAAPVSPPKPQQMDQATPRPGTEKPTRAIPKPSPAPDHSNELAKRRERAIEAHKEKLRNRLQSERGRDGSEYDIG